MDGNKKIKAIVYAGMIAVTLTACKVQSPGYVGLYVDTSVIDSIDPDKTSENRMDTAMIQMVHEIPEIEPNLPIYTHPVEEIRLTPSDSIPQQEIEKILEARPDSVHLSGNQMIEPQQQPYQLPDTSLAGEKPQEIQQLDSPQTDDQTLQLLMAKNEQIQRLQNQVDAMHRATQTTPQPIHVITEPTPVQLFSSQSVDSLSLQLYQAQIDTIQFLRSQLLNKKLKPPKPDSVYIEKEVFTNELVPAQKTFDPQPIHDTLQLLKTRIRSLEEQPLPGKDTLVLIREVERDAPNKEKTDTTLIVAFYKLGKIKPLEEEAILQQIKELCSNRNATKVTLSGYTDSSGNEIINKQITNKRLTYLLGKITLWISEEKIFIQNFGDSYASETVVNNERRIEIIILRKLGL